MCGELQGIGVLDFAHRGSDMVVSTAFNQDIRKQIVSIVVNVQLFVQQVP